MNTERAQVPNETSSDIPDVPDLPDLPVGQSGHENWSKEYVEYRYGKNSKYAPKDLK